MRAQGVRAGWAKMPAAVHAWVETEVGSVVADVAEQTGGMSPGCATRLRFADGQRAFVKCVGTPLNPDTPGLFRREITALEMIGTDPRWAGLRAWFDDGEWVALLLDDVEGRHPDLSDDLQMHDLLAATDDLAQELGRRGHNDVAHPERVTSLTDRFRIWAGAFERLDVVEPGWIPEIVLRNPAGWAERVVALGDFEPQLVHWDIRDDNLLVRPDGRWVFLDWGAASLGPAWADPLVARLERMDSPWFDDHLASSPALAALGDDGVDAFLAGFGVFLAWRASTAVDVNLPTLKQFRTVESHRALDALQRRRR